MADKGSQQTRPRAGIRIRSSLRSGLTIPANLKYSEGDEWFNPQTGQYGLTDSSQMRAGDVVFIEYLVAPGQFVTVGTPIAEIESIKANGHLYAPVSGRVEEINTSLQFNPSSVNSDPYGAGWMIKFNGADSSRLMNAADYTQWVESFNQ